MSCFTFNMTFNHTSEYIFKVNTFNKTLTLTSVHLYFNWKYHTKLFFSMNINMEDTSAHCTLIWTIQAFCINKFGHSLYTVVLQSIHVHNWLTMSTSSGHETLTIYKLCSCALIHYCIKIKARLEYILMFIMYTFLNDPFTNENWMFINCDCTLKLFLATVSQWLFLFSLMY